MAKSDSQVPVIGHNSVFLGRTDLALRWPHYSKVAVWKWTRRPDFPKPAGSINQGKHIFWILPDIEEYEAHHPELRSETKKDAKVRWYNAHYHEIIGDK